MSGGSDKILYAFSPNLPSDDDVATSVDTEEPLYALIGHEGNITTIEVAPEKEDLLALTGPTIYSGSWDMSIRVWENWTCTHVMTGHTQAVWSIALLSNGYLASGSADKTIKLWNNFQCVKTLTGHTDVVRSLAKLPLTGFA